MKPLSILFALICLGCSSSPKLGIFFAASPDVINSVGLRESWNSLLIQNQQSAQIYPVVIKSIKPDIGSRYYYLYSEDMSGTLKMAQLLNKKDKYLIVADSLNDVVVCNCEEEFPVIVNGVWICQSLEGNEGCPPLKWNVQYDNKIFPSSR